MPIRFLIEAQFGANKYLSYLILKTDILDQMKLRTLALKYIIWKDFCCKLDFDKKSGF